MYRYANERKLSMLNEVPSVPSRALGALSALVPWVP